MPPAPYRLLYFLRPRSETLAVGRRSLALQQVSLNAVNDVLLDIAVEKAVVVAVIPAGQGVVGGKEVLVVRRRGKCGRVDYERAVVALRPGVMIDFVARAGREKPRVGAGQ